jgi:diaminopimelate epimerase
MTHTPSNLAQLPFVKAHGTGNDFVVVDAVAHTVDFDGPQVAFLCNRHQGIGADGLLRIARASDFNVADARYFMDYRNADGSIAETCGNGLRVFARMLVELGYEQAGPFTIGTRAGTVTAFVDREDTNFSNVSIEMGIPRGIDEAAHVDVATDLGSFTGKPVFMPNPHCVVIVDEVADAGNLLSPPVIAAPTIFPQGTNVEFVASKGSSHISMRTHERGVGETLSCGSGACAAAFVWATEEGLESPWTIRIDVLGGTVYVDCDESGSLTLRGPAQIVAQGTVLGDSWTI